ncbi:hypothetical protein GLAREA_08066 [Glarea lozoyensis ATCC 20868]|uniref:Uncharacterized protein n=1 Tax=Glarea lozoyensis (strain ATCC 20868 / MF5171) TaxID=1116229 RepID=S3CWL6_GLAL2|nr:uncharacterized protein GLAREA_08066 [Glarea lozoyensis ATCC 20868]EPE24216.1 hypothetical protein GLAREA_08066 [Glarea lozoyensis ATCC 20868]
MAPQKQARLQILTHDVVKSLVYGNETKQCGYFYILVELVDTRVVRSTFDTCFTEYFEKGRGCRDFWQALGNELSGTIEARPGFTGDASYMLRALWLTLNSDFHEDDSNVIKVGELLRRTYARRIVVHTNGARIS